MFRWIIGSSLKFRYLVIAAAMAMVLFGVDQLRNMPIDVFGISTEEIEELITIPMEETLRGTAELDKMRSQSVVGLSATRLFFKQGTDILRARQLVQERLQVAVPNLPASAGRPIMLQPLSATSRAMKIGISSKEISTRELSVMTYWRLRPQLLSVPGVANVAIWGFKKRQLQVLFDPDRMAKHDVTVDRLLEVVAESLDLGLIKSSASAKTRIEGFIDTPAQRLGIHIGLPVVQPEDLANVPIQTDDNGTTLRLKDVARVEWNSPLLIGDSVINDGPGLMLVVEKFPWANTLEVTHNVEAALTKLKRGLPGIEIDHEIFRPATFIEQSIENLTFALLLGSVFVVLVLLAFLYEWRVALISLIAIPLSLVAAGIVLYLYSVTINTMVLAGFVVALGSIVDDAIIDVENILRRLRQNGRLANPLPVARVIVDASLEIRSAIIFATLVIVMAVMPVFFMGGLSGAFFTPLATAYALALIASMVVALTITPALSYMLLDRKAVEHAEAPLVGWLQRGYESMLTKIMAAPRAAFGLAAALTVAGLAVWPYLGQSLLPSFKERDFLMHWVIKPGSSHAEMVRITQASSRELRAIPGVRNFGAHIGRAEAADEVVGMNFTENWISVDRNADYKKTLAAIEDTVDGYPGIYRDVQTYLKERIKEVLTGSSEAIVVRIFGPDLKQLRSVADDVKQGLNGIEGMVNLHTELQVEIPQIQIKVDLEKAAMVGLKPGDVRRAAAAVLAGYEVSDIFKDGKIYDVFVWGMPEKRSSLTSVENVLIDVPTGGHVRLADIASVKIAPTANVIKREDFSRRIDVAANVKGREVGAVAEDVERRVRAMKLPQGYYAQVLGEYAEREAAQNRMMLVSGVAIIGIFLLLQNAFGSWRLATMAFLALPAAMVGGVIAALFGGGVISLGSLVGFLTVLGIAARNSILLIHHCQHLEREEGEKFGLRLVIRGARERLSPILMTSLCTGLALLPLIIYGDLPGHEIEYPMAVVILGGLVTSTLLSLFLVPVLYLRYGAGATRAAALETSGLVPAE
jgi:CzcA family heavy metal efflux pump